MPARLVGCQSRLISLRQSLKLQDIEAVSGSLICMYVPEGDLKESEGQLSLASASSIPFIDVPVLQPPSTSNVCPVT
jgi:hypothetical protein